MRERVSLGEKERDGEKENRGRESETARKRMLKIESVSEIQRKRVCGREEACVYAERESG